MIDFLNHWSQAWIRFFGPAVVQNTIFLGFVFLALHLLRRGTARFKYTITLIGLIKLLLPPFVPAPFWSESATRVTSVVTTMSIQPAIGISSFPSDVPLSIDPLSVVCAIWLLGTVICLLIPLISTALLRHRLKGTETVSHENDKNLLSSIQVIKSDQISMPLTIGINPKKIFVPPLWDQWSEECRGMILRHELAHINRRDGLVQLLQSMVQAIYFFHPLVWLLSKKMNEYREMACDDSTVGQDKHTSVEYSRYLVEIAEEITQNQLGCSSASALIRQKHQLLNRVKYQMEDAMTNLSKRKVGIVFIGLILLTAGLSWTRGNPGEIPANETNLTPLNLPVNPISQETGKIWGTVTDKKSGEPLPAVNIFVEGTTLGAASDEKGQFVILNVPPGAYSLKAEMMGFESKIISRVMVRKDDFARVDFKLEAAVVSPQTGKKKSDAPPPPPSKDDEERPIFIKHDVEPVPIGGYAAIQGNITYPELARRAGVEGRAMIWTKIDTDGKILTTKVMRSLGPYGCDEVAMKAIRSVKWKPAMQNNKPIAVWVAVPVDFRQEKIILDVLIKGSNHFLIDGEAATLDNIDQTVKKKVKEHEDMMFVLNISAERNVTMGTVVDIFRRIKDLSVGRVNFHFE